jgi:hypothetical protein
MQLFFFSLELTACPVTTIYLGVEAISYLLSTWELTVCLVTPSYLELALRPGGAVKGEARLAGTGFLILEAGGTGPSCLVTPSYLKLAL